MPPSRSPDPPPLCLSLQELEKDLQERKARKKPGSRLKTLPSGPILDGSVDLDDATADGRITFHKRPLVPRKFRIRDRVPDSACVCWRPPLVLAPVVVTRMLSHTGCLATIAPALK